MALTIGEMVIALSIKGADMAGKAIGNVTKEMSNLSFSSFLSKAAIMGVVYGLGSLAKFAAGAGMSMMNFNRYTGTSTDLLQKWSVLGIKSGMSLEDMQGDMDNIQATLSRMKNTGEAPRGWDRFVAEMTMMGEEVDYFKMGTDMDYTMKKLNFWIANTKSSIPVINDYAKSIGLSMKGTVLMRMAVHDLSKIDPSLIMTTKELERQSKVKQQWDLLWKKMEISGQRIAMTYASDAVKALGSAFDWVKGVTDRISLLIKKMPELGNNLVGLGILIAGYFNPVSAVILGIIYLLDELAKKKAGQPSKLDVLPERWFKEETKEEQLNRYQKTMDAIPGFFGDRLKNLMSDYEQMKTGNISNVAPVMPPNKSSANEQNVNINQIINNHGDLPKNQEEVNKMHKDGAKTAWYQVPTRVIVS